MLSSQSLPCTGDHKRLPWLVASVCIVGYSFGILGLAALLLHAGGAGHLGHLPHLRLHDPLLVHAAPAGRARVAAEYWLLWALIPLSLAFSVVGLGSSVWALINNLGGGAL